MVMDTLGLDAKKVNPKGGAIALGVSCSGLALAALCTQNANLGFPYLKQHPLGAT